MDIDVTTRAMLKLLILPPGILLLALAIGWVFARRLAGRVLLLAGTAGFYLLSTPAVVFKLAELVETIPAPTQQQLLDSDAQGILVLMASVSRNNPELDGADALSSMSLQRIDHALALHRQTGLPIIVSGGSISGDSESLAALAAAWLEDRANVQVIAADDQSRDTWENARESAAKLRTAGISRVLLVTHAFHMPRAMMSIRSAGIDAVPAPFGFMHTPLRYRDAGKTDSWMPIPGILGKSYLILHEILGLAWYRLSHR
jgi:uncharacterized SAM-binding protein YcdF (DUF218 family)